MRSSRVSNAPNKLIQNELLKSNTSVVDSPRCEDSGEVCNRLVDAFLTLFDLKLRLYYII